MLNAIEVIMICLLGRAALTDLALRRIPNVLILSGLLLALILHLLGGPRGAVLSDWLAGALTGLVLFLPLYVLRGMAAGDVKLMAMVGAFVGPADAARVALLAYLIGGAMALLMLLRSGRWREGWSNLGQLCKPLLWRLAGVPLAPLPRAPMVSVGGMPYGVAIALAAVALVAWKHR